MRALLPLLVLLVACETFAGGRSRERERERREEQARRHPPGELEVEEAAAELAARVRRLYSGGSWPTHLARSRDFPALPLVALEPMLDEAGSGADVGHLQATLEEAVRRDRQLRLEADELAVPPSLREEEDGKEPQPVSPSPAGLELRAWIDKGMRIRLTLVDRDKGEQLVQARSRS